MLAGGQGTQNHFNTPTGWQGHNHCFHLRIGQLSVGVGIHIRCAKPLRRLARHGFAEVGNRDHPCRGNSGRVLDVRLPINPATNNT